MGAVGAKVPDLVWPLGAFTWLGLGVLAFSLSELSLMTPFVEQGTALFWLVSGLTMGVLINLPFGSWPGALLATFIFCLASNLNHSIPLGLSVTFATANIIEAACGAALFSFWTEGQNRSLVAQGVLLTMAGAISASIGAIVGVGALVLSGDVAEISRSYFLWYVADLLGIVLVAPFALAWWPHRAWSQTPTNHHFSIEMALWIALSLFTSYATFWQDLTTLQFAPLLYAQFGLLVFCALRLGARGATAVGLCITAVAVSGTLIGHGPFTAASNDVVEQATNLQIYLVAISFAGLIPGLFVSQQAQLKSGVPEESLPHLVEPGPESTPRAQSHSSDFARENDAKRDAEPAVDPSDGLELRVLGDVAAGAAHDFNNLLMAIQGSAQVLSFEAKDAQKELLDDILEACQLARRLTTQLTSLRGEDRVHFEDVSLNQILNEIQRLISRVLGKELQLELVFPAHELRVRTDPRQLERYLLQLAYLVRRYFQGGGALTLVAREDDASADVVVLEWIGSASVTDEQHTYRAAMEHLAETNTAPTKGIFADDSIRKRLDGSIQVGEDRATTIVQLRLKKAEVFTAAVPPSRASRPAEAPHGTRILVVEDGAELRAPLQRLLIRKGFQPTLVSDSEGALDLLKREEFDIVLTDLALPGMNGQELRDQIQRLWPTLPVLFMSGSNDDSVAPRLQGRAAHQLLRKPFTGQELGDAISAALGDEREPQA